MTGFELKNGNLVLTLLSFVWLSLCSIMTIFKYAPETLNADILLNAVMSLQNVTLYYWGQNRLINILPLTASIIHDPSFNLAAVLFLPSISFFLFLFVLSKILTRTTGSTRADSTKLFIILSSLFLIIFTGDAITTIVFWHVEYSFPALLISIVFYITWFVESGRCKWIFITSILLVIAIGINPATLLLTISTVFFSVVYSKKVNLRYVVIASTSIVSFIFWHYISKMYGDASYNEFVLQKIPDGINRIAVGLINSVDVYKIFLITGVYLLFVLTRFVVKCQNVCNFTAVQRYTIAAIFLFSIGWFLLFSASTWVEMNMYNWRYFIYIIFGGLIVVGLYIFITIKQLGNIGSWLLVFIMLGTAMESIYRKPISFLDYEVFKRVHELSPESNALYAGDYWVVWPAVLRDLMLGKPSLGLAYRADGNRVKVNNYISNEMKKNGHVTVRCLNDTVENCTNQIGNFVTTISVLDVVELQDEVSDIKVADKIYQ